MSIKNFIPQLWSARLQANLDAAVVLASLSIINEDWAGEITDVGGTVRIQRPGNITVKPYDAATTDVDYEVPTSTTSSLTIDQDEFYAFQIDDLDAMQSNVALVNTFTNRAAVAVAEKLDKHVAGLYTAAGAGDVELTLGAGSYYDALVDAGKNLDKKNVPRAGRWHVTSPEGYAALLKADEFIHSTAAGDSVIRSGEVGRAAGFDIYVSNLLVSVTDVTKALYGTTGAITHARQLLGTPEAIRLETKFADAVRGRVAYGSKVVSADELGTLSLT